MNGRVGGEGPYGREGLAPRLSRDVPMENEQNYDAAWEENKTGADIAWQWEPIKQLVEVGAH